MGEKENPLPARLALSPGGVKPSCVAQHGQEVMNPKGPDEDFAEAVGIAQAEEPLLSHVNPDDYLGETVPGR